MHLGNLAKQAKLMQNHFRMFDEAGQFISEVQSLAGLVKELTKQKASLLGDIARLESARATGSQELHNAIELHKTRTKILDADFGAQNMKIKKALETTSADVGRKIKGIDDRLIVAEEAHEIRMTEMREEIETTEAGVQTARSAAAQLKHDVERLGAGQ